MNKFPKREELINPMLRAFKELGGSGTNDEINQMVIKLMDIPEAITEIPHKAYSRNSSITQLEYELAWVRTMLKNQGIIENSQRGIWALRQIDSPIIQVISSPNEKRISDELDENEHYKEEMLNLITEKLSPSGFERLIQRFLREKGFTQVEVTGRSGDGGIDGKGIAKINGILSFHIIFQCKRYKGKVTASEIRDFRGAMTGRTDKGLFITSGSFTKDAVNEATRDGAPAIDLMDGEKLAEKLKELSLGVKIETKEVVKVDHSWFDSFID